MLGNEYFFFDLIKKYQILFGSMFNNIIIQRTDANNQVTQIINVPVEYIEKEKMLTRMKADPDINRQASVVLPRISYFLDGYEYNSSLQVPRTNLTNITQVNSNATYQYAPAPYKFGFTAWVYAKNIEDGNKILEQICPYFTPNFTIRAFLIQGAPAVDLPITLHSISHEDTDSPDFKERQTLIWTLHFTLNGYFWGPKINQPTINLANVSFFVGTPLVSNSANVHAFGLTDQIIDTAMPDDSELSGTLTFQPGLDANGNPTSNAADSIPVANINWSDNWGIIEIMNGLQYD